MATKALIHRRSADTVIADAALVTRGRTKSLTEFEARALTDDIRGTTVRLWLLIGQAHDRRAWAALGYETWKDYVAPELKMSESRSFQILDQARVMREIARAGGDPLLIEPPPARVVARIKDVLPRVRRAAEAAIQDGMSIEDAIRDLANSLTSELEGDLRTAASRSNGRAKASTVEVEEAPPRGQVWCPCCEGYGVVAPRKAKALLAVLEDASG